MSINSPTSLSGIDRQLLADRVYDDSAEANSARWKLFLSQDEAPVGGLPFDATKLQARARQRSPSAHYGSVTHFTDWIFGLYGKSKKSEALLRGLAAEALIYKARVPVPTAEGWRLIHCGLHLPVPSQNRKRYKISSLAVLGTPLAASPDYIFRRADPSGSSTYLVVEIKHTSAPIPRDLWPNVRAQLWAYGQIDDFSDATEVILVAEVWSGDKVPGLRRSVSWRRTDNSLAPECIKLFTLYKESIEGQFASW